MKYSYHAKGTCATIIDFDLTDDKVTEIKFTGGCNGNLKAIAKLVDGFTVNQIVENLSGNTCGNKQTSCSDQLAIAVSQAYELSS